MKKLFLILLICLTTSIAASPQTPIEIIVPYQPGGAASDYARLVAKMLTDHGKPSIVINRPGGDAVIGANLVAKSTPDGHTLLLGTTSTMSANLVFPPPGIEYNKQSFVPIVQLNQLSMVLAVPANSPVKNYEQFKFYVRANPEKFNLGFYNAGIANIFYDWAERENLPAPNIVLYKGSGQLDIDLASGSIPFAFDNFAAPIVPLINDGRIRVIATLDSKSVQYVSKELRIDPPANLSIDFGVWYGLFAPAGTPAPAITELNSIINQSKMEPRYKEELTALKITQFGGTPNDLSQLQKRDFNTLKKLAH